jgi:hypothetical protein
LRFLKYQTKLTKYWIAVFNVDSQRNIALVDISKKQQRVIKEVAQTIEERRVTEENDILIKHFFMKTIVILPHHCSYCDSVFCSVHTYWCLKSADDTRI